MISETRVLGIHCPRDGRNEDAITWRYRAWFWLYETTRRVEHRIGRHQKPRGYSIAPRCDWCGHRTPRQQRTAEHNWLQSLGPDEFPRGYYEAVARHGHEEDE